LRFREERSGLSNRAVRNLSSPNAREQSTRYRVHKINLAVMFAKTAARA
jgi:hypothetical protein